MAVQRAAIGMALFSALLGAAGLLSWSLRMPVLRSFGIGSTGMSPLTGVTLLVSAVAVVAAHRGARSLARAGGAIAVAIGVIALGEWVLGVPGGLAQRLLPEGERGALAGRMSVPASVIFVLIGAAQLLLRLGRAPLRRPSDYLAMLSAFAAFTVVTAYAYGATSFAPMLGAAPTGMALPTGLAMFALALSTLLVDARRGLASILLSEEPGGFFARRIVLFAALVPPALGVLLTAGHGFGLEDTLAQLAVLTILTSSTAIFAVLLAAHRLNWAAAQRRRAEERLRVAEARLRGLIDHAPEAILAVDERGEIVLANERAATLFGRDVLNLSFETLLPRALERAAAHPEAPLQIEIASLRGAVPVELTCSRVTAGPARTTVILRDVSERARAEETQRIAEARFRLIFEHASDGIFIATPDGTYADVNEAGARLLGTTREQIVGKTIVDFIRPEDVPRLAKDRDDVFAGRTRVSEWQMRRGDDTWVDVEVATRLLPDGRWVGLARDITERKAAEEKIRQAHEAEQHLRRQLEAISDATTAVAEAVTRLPQSDVATVLHTVVLQARAITGARYGALGIGGDDQHPFDPWIVSGVPDEFVRAMGRAPRPLGLLGIVAREGKCVRIDDLSSVAFPPGHLPLRTLLGVPIRYHDRPVGNLYLSDKADGTAFTGDDQRALEILADRVAIALETARLYEAEARERSWLQITIDQMPEPVILADGSGRATSWNLAASCLLHADADVPFDLRWPDGKRLEPQELPFHRACASGEFVSSVELVAIASNGHPVPVLASAAPLPSDEHGARGAVAILKDISHQKQLERLREEWTAIVAHDLRQPVASIALAAELLQRRALGAEEAKLVERIRSGAERVRGMVDDLLDYAQIEAGRLRIAPRPVDLKPLVTEVVERLAPSTLGHPIRLVVKHVETHASVDPGRIDQVLTNLVSNAAKYGYAGTEILVTVGGRAAEIELTVENRGPGMTPDEVAHLFERFGRMATAEARGVKGIGLGLFITKGIVDAHGGRIWAESTPRETTTFHVVLPALPTRRAA